MLKHNIHKSISNMIFYIYVLLIFKMGCLTKFMMGTNEFWVFFLRVFLMKEFILDSWIIFLGPIILHKMIEFLYFFVLMIKSNLNSWILVVKKITKDYYF